MKCEKCGKKAEELTIFTKYSDKHDGKWYCEKCFEKMEEK